MQKILLPQVIFGTSGLGNLYVAQSDNKKRAIVSECMIHSAKPAVFDSAGKYGAGLALESLGKSLKELNVLPGDVMISNKLGWLRTELSSAGPTFEPGVWKDLQFDAVQKISYEGILECFEQGNQLLNGYRADLVSVHDPDEYIRKADSPADADKRYHDILDAYRALHELKSKNIVKGIGIGSKDWRVIKRIAQEVELDWVMIANSMTIHNHPRELVDFMKKLNDNEVQIINSAVFNGGFLTGSDFYNYQPVSVENNFELYRWRTNFYQVCKDYNLKPVEVCVSFGLNAPGVTSIALNTTNPERVAENVGMPLVKIPGSFWRRMKSLGLIDKNYTNNYIS